MYIQTKAYEENDTKIAMKLKYGTILVILLNRENTNICVHQTPMDHNISILLAMTIHSVIREHPRPRINHTRRPLVHPNSL